MADVFLDFEYLAMRVVESPALAMYTLEPKPG
eukprot:CAMPEP_0201679412 /NCGR_PEP_ID=MMETSP0494-20130426/48378_1 /ASSEMBLY_ACC=CAM_ASM_000839 /TAXON_ID=420259 /ORGANISM="Thalassiosira gravida, Strain GMp14c1" /LENGTH=31 /DNA_ID= /DNA_START= /DNA_END= /DNA_ORIENTATION=